jgi:hypothetical protein
MSRKVIRFLKLFTAFFLSFSLLASAAFETFHKGHEETCHEENCAVCLVLQIIHAVNIFSSDISAKASEFTAFFYINIVILSAFICAPRTLVKQKVKLVI